MHLTGYLSSSKQGLYCAQIMVQLALDAEGKENTELVDAVRGLCGGFAWSGGPCGVLIGGICLLTMLGRELSEEEKIKLIGEYHDWFRQRTVQYGGENCDCILRATGTICMSPVPASSWTVTPSASSCCRSAGSSDVQGICKTRSVCPVCLGTIDAEKAVAGDGYGAPHKTCPEHGFFLTRAHLGSRHSGLPQWGGTAPAAEPEGRCPRNCGLCAAHESEGCCVLLELTRRCDLRCPVCFASAGGEGDLSLDEVARALRHAHGPAAGPTTSSSRAESPP